MRKSLRILVLTQYYAPETGASQNRLADLVTRLSESHSVTVLTAMPNYPQGEIFRGYKGRILLDEKQAGVRIIRTWLYATKSKKIVPRIANFISFAVLAVLVGMVKTGRQDVVFVDLPPLFLGMSAWFLCRLKRCKLVLNVADLWPESAVALGVLRNRSLIGVASWIEEFLYRRANFITGQTRGIVSNIANRFPSKAVQLMPNGVNTETFLSASEKETARRRVRMEFGFIDSFAVGFTGLHGLAQSLNTVLDAAEILAEHEDILFLFFGDGPEKQELIRQSKLKGLNNVRFYPPQPAAHMPHVLSALDVAIVPLRRHKIFEGALPSKLFENMGSAIPVIVAIQGEAKSLVEAANGGICIEPENASALAQAVLHLRNDEPLRRRMGESGRAFVTLHYSRQKIARRFEEVVLASVIGQSHEEVKSLASGI